MSIQQGSKPTNFFARQDDKPESQIILRWQRKLALSSLYETSKDMRHHCEQSFTTQ
jgi:hypothetical protein